MTDLINFRGFPKLGRMKRNCIITEKIDGTNAQVVVSACGTMLRAASRTRWITPADDNYGFAAWVEVNKAELLTLGPGQHFGEWWGRGIQRNYGMTERKFSLFNVSRWGFPASRPACCDVVPLLKATTFTTEAVSYALSDLITGGSKAAPGWMKPEGVVVLHSATGAMFKTTIEKDDEPKSLNNNK